MFTKVPLNVKTLMNLHHHYGTGKQSSELTFMNLGAAVTKTYLPSLKEKLEGVTETVGELKAINMEHVETLTRDWELVGGINAGGKA